MQHPRQLMTESFMFIIIKDQILLKPGQNVSLYIDYYKVLTNFPGKIRAGLREILAGTQKWDRECGQTGYRSPKPPIPAKTPFF